MKLWVFSGVSGFQDEGSYVPRRGETGLYKRTQKSQKINSKEYDAKTQGLPHPTEPPGGQKPLFCVPRPACLLGARREVPLPQRLQAPRRSGSRPVPLKGHVVSVPAETLEADPNREEPSPCVLCFKRNGPRDALIRKKSKFPCRGFMHAHRSYHKMKGCLSPL